MTENQKTQVRAKTWLKPSQVEDLREACYDESFPSYLRQRNEVIITTLYDLGLRVGELVALDLNHLHLDEEEPYIYLPSEIQKQPPQGEPPAPVPLEFSEDLDTARNIKSYLANRWKDTETLFPSRNSDRMTTQAVRNMTKKAARLGGVEPIHVDGSRGTPDEVTPHTLRHSVAYRMLNEEGERLYDVRNRLRHRSIQTTEQIYEHFIVR